MKMGGWLVDYSPTNQPPNQQATYFQRSYPLRNVDFLVLGLGAMGSATLFHLAHKGLRAVGIEQFEPGHALGSSGGRSRVFRTFYHDPLYVSLAQAALPRWQNLETLSGERLLHLNGWLAYARPGNANFEHHLKIVEAANLPLERLTGEQVSERFPALRLPEAAEAAYMPQAGFIDAQRAVLTHLQQAKRLGAEIESQTQVRHINLESDRPEVQTASERYRCRRLVITAGPWAGQLLNDLALPLKVTRQQKFYFQPADPAKYLSAQLPVYADEDLLFYGFPYHTSGLKVADDNHGPAVSPDTVDRTIDTQKQQQLQSWLETIMPADRFTIVKAETCTYTLTPDRDFLIGPHPEQPTVLIGAGFSGHGFKFSTLVGLILAQLAADGGTAYPIERFRLDRFG